MMKSYRHITSLILAFVILSFSACSNDDYLLPEDGKNVSVTFRPTLGGDLNTRAIGDASSIDRLQVVVYEGSVTLSKTFSFSEQWYNVERNGITLTLIEGRSYKILFWADDEDNSVYTLTDEGKVSVNYTDYVSGGFAKIEEMDAFCGTSSITVSSQKNENKQIELTRPLAQLNFADNTTNPQQGTHKAVVTFHSIPTSFNPFTGEVSLSDTEDVTFTFTDFPEENLILNGTTYYYVSCNYLFALTTGKISVSATLDLQQSDGTSINKFEFKGDKAITLEKNKKTNVLGAIVQQPETWSVWDGTIPTESTLTTDSENRYIINDAADIAWLSVSDNTNTLENNKTFILTSDIDMANKDGLSSIQLPEGSILDGNGHIIKGLKLNGGLLGNATSVSVENLTIEESNISNTNTEVTHIGALANTLSGSAIFTNVTIKNSSVSTSNGAAGGIIGYVSRKKYDNRSEKLNVTFDNCHVVETSIDGSHSEGHFVGLLRGYDNDETLTFNSNCTLTLSQAATVASDFVSPYTEGNEGAWLADNDYTRYNGWLGDEECYRGKVFYGSNRFIPRWDGKTTVAPLAYNNESNKYEVYSAFDLAGVREKTASPAAVYLMENVDMNGQGTDGKYNVPSNWTQSAYNSEDDNYFKSFSTIANLEGNGKGIYNLNINTQKVSTSLYYGGFIQSTSGTTTHQNIKFYNCCVVVPLVVYKNEDKGSAGMLVSNIAGDSYTMKNVHTYGCKIFALQKVGGLAARVAATTSTISECSVNNCFIENYKYEQNLEKFEKSISSLNVSVTASFYSYGEVGGMFGFVENNATISGCHVKGSTIHAYGQDDKEADMKGSGFLGSFAVAAAKGLGYFLVPGRHVSTFIGDICTSDDQGDKINIQDCTIDSNTKCTNRYDKHNETYTSIGQAYYVEFKDTKGSVTVDGQELTLANGNKNTVR